MWDNGLIGYSYDSQYGVSKVEQEQQVAYNAHNRLVNATDPWHAFYYLVVEHMDVTALSTISAKIGTFADQMTKMSWFTQDVEKIKEAFFDPQTHSLGPGVDPGNALRAAVGALLNRLIGQNVAPTDGSPMNWGTFTNALSHVGDSTNTTVFSSKSIREMIDQLMKTFNVTPKGAGILDGSANISDIWAQAESHPVSAGGQSANLPYPAALQGYVDGMSSLGGYAKGVSGAETQILTHEQKTYFMVAAYLKSLFGDFYHQSATPVRKEKSS